MAQRIRKETYERLADIIHREVATYDAPPTQLRRLVVAMADDFQKDNPEFKRGLWLLQCGVSG